MEKTLSEGNIGRLRCLSPQPKRTLRPAKGHTFAYAHHAYHNEYPLFTQMIDYCENNDREVRRRRRRHGKGRIDTRSRHPEG